MLCSLGEIKQTDLIENIFRPWFGFYWKLFTKLSSTAYRLGNQQDFLA